MLHGAMVGKGAQIKSDAQEATVPGPADLVILHVADGMKAEVRKVFRLMSSKGDGVDCCEKACQVFWHEETVRSRKKRIRTANGYSCCSNLLMFSARATVPDLVPEKKRSVYQGYNTGDVVGFVEALAPSAQWQTTRVLKEKILGSTCLKLTTAEDISF